jgi:hypothetical protein
LIAEQFTPLDIECLARTAVELWEGTDTEDLSARQKDVLEQARTALQAEFEGKPPAPQRTVLVDAFSAAKGHGTPHSHQDVEAQLDPLTPRTFTMHFEDRRPFTVTVQASSFAEARSRAEEKLDTACERYADDETCRLLTHHTCTEDSQVADGPPLVPYVLEFTEKHSARVRGVKATSPEDAEEQVRRHWDSYTLSAEYSGGFELTLRSAEPALVWKERQPDTSQAPF